MLTLVKFNRKMNELLEKENLPPISWKLCGSQYVSQNNSGEYFESEKKINELIGKINQLLKNEGLEGCLTFFATKGRSANVYRLGYYTQNINMKKIRDYLFHPLLDTTLYPHPFDNASLLLHTTFEVKAPDIIEEYKNVIFILDNSGSMDGNSIKYLKHVTHTLIQDVNENDSVSIITFNETATLCAENVQATKLGKEDLSKTLQNITANGKTDLVEPFKLIEKLCNSEKRNIVVFVTDGCQTVENSYPDIAQAVMEYANNVTLIPIGIGPEYDSKLMNKISQLAYMQNIHIANEDDYDKAGIMIKIMLRPQSDPIKLQIVHEEVAITIQNNLKFVLNMPIVNTIDIKKNLLTIGTPTCVLLEHGVHDDKQFVSQFITLDVLQEKLPLSILLDWARGQIKSIIDSDETSQTKEEKLNKLAKNMYSVLQGITLGDEEYHMCLEINNLITKAKAGLKGDENQYRAVSYESSSTRASYMPLQRQSKVTNEDTSSTYTNYESFPIQRNPSSKVTNEDTSTHNNYVPLPQSPNTDTISTFTPRLDKATKRTPVAATQGAAANLEPPQKKRKKK